MDSSSIAKHTPGPAKAISDRVTIGGRYNLCPHVTAGGSARGMIDEREVAAANAARIALTWNCHDDLLVALKAISEFMPTTTASEGGASSYSANVAAADMVRAAIARAEGAAQ